MKKIKHGSYLKSQCEKYLDKSNWLIHSKKTFKVSK